MGTGVLQELCRSAAGALLRAVKCYQVQPHGACRSSATCRRVLPSASQVLVKCYHRIRDATRCPRHGATCHAPNDSTAAPTVPRVTPLTIRRRRLQCRRHSRASRLAALAGERVAVAAALGLVLVLTSCRERRLEVELVQPHVGGELLALGHGERLVRRAVIGDAADGGGVLVVHGRPHERAPRLRLDR